MNAPLAGAGTQVLFNGMPNTPPARHTRKTPIHPDTNGLPYDFIFRNDANALIAAISTIIAIVAHHKIVPGRYNESALETPPPRHEQ